jgi:protocatechuate 3,4-dioxygenase beta subunit
VSGASTTISLYNSNAVFAVNVLAKVTGVVVTYDDFITGVATSKNVAPNDNMFTYTGSVVDANGAGVPGAPVVITGSGFQFAKTGTTTYSIDSITLAASEAGSFSVDVYAHVASLTQKLTVTSGTKTASSVIASAIPVDGNGTDGSTGLLSAANLKFSWDAPATPVMNTTYAVTATVTDKWGNPVKGAAVTFGGFAAALFNGVASTNKVTGSDGTAVAFLRSIKDVSGLAAIGVTLTDVDQDADAKSDTDDLATVFLNAEATVWDESTWSAAIEAQVTFFTSAADLPASGDQKVNAGSFKGYVALYAKGYEGQRMSAKVGNDWVIVPAIPAATNDLFRAVEFVGAGVEISVRIYIDRVLLATIPLLTK